MFEQLALLADLKRRNIMIVDDALKLKNEMSDFKVLIYSCIYNMSILNIYRYRTIQII